MTGLKKECNFMLYLLPLYTERQIEIAFELSDCVSNGCWFNWFALEIEFHIQPTISMLLKDKKFVKSLRVFLHKNNKCLKKRS